MQLPIKLGCFKKTEKLQCESLAAELPPIYDSLKSENQSIVQISNIYLLRVNKLQLILAGFRSDISSSLLTESLIKLCAKLSNGSSY